MRFDCEKPKQHLSERTGLEIAHYASKLSKQAIELIMTALPRSLANRRWIS